MNTFLGKRIKEQVETERLIARRGLLQRTCERSALKSSSRLLGTAHPCQAAMRIQLYFAMGISLH